MKTVYFAGGCFWCIEYFFRMQKGVILVTSGYSGGKEDKPTYEQVKAQLTGHRETIKIDFDESIISLENLIDTYFAHIDPTDEKGQFGDIGHSYTLAMYYQNDVEKQIFNQKIDELKKKLNSDVYIKVEPFLSFYIAEERHQNFACKNPTSFMKELKDSGRKK